jgi:hypothetical protein
MEGRPVLTMKKSTGARKPPRSRTAKPSQRRAGVRAIPVTRPT